MQPIGIAPVIGACSLVGEAARMNINRKITCYRACAFAGLAGLAWIALAAQVEAQSSTVPRYNGNGDLLAPVGIETWVLVGSNLGLGYKTTGPVPPDKQQFHNVYINPEAYAHFVATREFPVPTVLVIEKFAAEAKEAKDFLASGLYDGQWQGLEVAVKNPARPDGKKTPWAYYDFTDPKDPTKPVASAAAEDDVSCENCHRDHAMLDHVWVQFYPTLKKLLK
jgi:Cytochrome P460